MKKIKILLLSLIVVFSLNLPVSAGPKDDFINGTKTLISSITEDNPLLRKVLATDECSDFVFENYIEEYVSKASAPTPESTPTLSQNTANTNSNEATEADEETDPLLDFCHASSYLELEENVQKLLDAYLEIQVTKALYEGINEVYDTFKINLTSPRYLPRDKLVIIDDITKEAAQKQAQAHFDALIDWMKKDIYNNEFLGANHYLSEYIRFIAGSIITDVCYKQPDMLNCKHGCANIVEELAEVIHRLLSDDTQTQEQR